MRSTKKTLLRGILMLPLALTAVIAWAFFWPGGPCNDPSCARERFELFIEMDAFRGVEPIALEVETPEGPVSPRSVMSSGGIDVRIEADDRELPYDPESGPLDRADLYQYARAWRNRAAPSSADAHIYALIAPALVSDRGERLFGIMFDSAGREGVAIAPQQTVRTFHRDAEAVPLLHLRTFTHEILHSLNRRHQDAVQMRDGRLTLEAPTRCITARDGTEWYLTETPLMALSPATIEFFQTAAPRDVLPGSANTPFDGLHASANECADARANRAEHASGSRWEFAKRRLFGLLGIESASAQEEQQDEEPQPTGDDEVADTADDEADDESETPSDEPGLLLLIQAQEAPYPLGFPIAIRVIAHNRSTGPLALKGRLTPPYGLVRIEYRFKGEEQWRIFKPLIWYEPADDQDALLEPDGYAEQTAAIYFGDDGWTFAQPGEYEIRATIKPREDSDRIASNVLSISIAEPQTDEERAALAPLLDSTGALDADIGRMLTFGGRITDEEAHDSIEAAVAQHAHTALGSALKLTLGSQHLSPPIDPLTGERASPQFADAQALFEDTCTDSGIAALKFELLERFGAKLPNEIGARLRSTAEAWDGASAANENVPSYSDPGLNVFDTSLHFCKNEAGISPDIRKEAARVARQIERIGSKRIIVTGHADYEGTCRFNDALALRRAEAVRSLLINAGVPPQNIRAVSLGERRPLSFSNTAEARALNRRVEILYEPPLPAEAIPPDEEPQTEREMSRVMPGCEEKERNVTGDE